MLWRRIHLPVEIVAGEDAFRRGARVIDSRKAQVSSGRSTNRSHERPKIPILDAGNCSGKRIQKQLMRIEAMALFRLIGPSMR